MQAVDRKLISIQQLGMDESGSSCSVTLEDEAEQLPRAHQPTSTMYDSVQTEYSESLGLTCRTATLPSCLEVVAADAAAGWLASLADGSTKRRRTSCADVARTDGAAGATEAVRKCAYGAGTSWHNISSMLVKVGPEYDPLTVFNFFTFGTLALNVGLTPSRMKH